MSSRRSRPSPPGDRLADRQVARGHRRRPRRGGSPQGPALPPRPDARPRGGHTRGHGQRGAARDACCDPPAACRVARLRDAFRRGRTKRYRSGLREIASRLGAVRDLDVLLDAADLTARTCRRSSSAASSHCSAAGASIATTRACCSCASSTRTATGAGSTTTDFVRTEGAAVIPVGPVEPHRVRDTAPSRIWGAYQHVRGYEPVLRWADVETLHELRIAGKWLRYTLEFVREPLGPDATPLITRVVALQDHLGLMNDANVSAHMARTFLVEHAGELSSIERRDRPLPRGPRTRRRAPAADDRATVARRRGGRLPALAGTGGRRALGSPQPRQPWASSGRRSRQAAAAWCTARIAPSGGSRSRRACGRARIARAARPRSPRLRAGGARERD